MEGSSDNEVIEHNVIRGGSWPVQAAGGEFRYNLVIDSGHMFWRSARNNVRIHHNVFANASGPNTGYDAGIATFSGETGLRVYNNTSTWAARSAASMDRLSGSGRDRSSRPSATISSRSS